MMKRRGVVAAIAVLTVLGSGCSRGAQTAEQVPGATGGTSYRTRLGSSVAADTAWPIPSDAERTESGIPTKVVFAGTGRVHPRVGHDDIVGLALVRYDRMGRIAARVPFKTQAMDLAPTEWREVLTRMTLGEVRRAWLVSEGGDVSPYDFELQRLAPGRR